MFNTLTRMSVSLVQKYLPSPFVFSALLTLGVLLLICRAVARDRREAKKGHRVVRLKGGDPFIFGRGGEEIHTLIEHGIGFEVVPGITAATGASTYAGIPLTHRDHAQSVVFTTGHLQNDTVDLNWTALAQPGQTLVFYMGLTGLPVICDKLIAHGLPTNTPIALIESATTEQQKVVTGTLATIPDDEQAKALKPPTLIIVGGVVSLHKTLNWFNS